MYLTNSECAFKMVLKSNIYQSKFDGSNNLEQV